MFEKGRNRVLVVDSVASFVTGEEKKPVLSALELELRDGSGDPMEMVKLFPLTRTSFISSSAQRGKNEYSLYLVSWDDISHDATTVQPSIRELKFAVDFHSETHEGENTSNGKPLSFILDACHQLDNGVYFIGHYTNINE